MFGSGWAWFKKVNILPAFISDPRERILDMFRMLLLWFISYLRRSSRCLFGVHVRRGLSIAPGWRNIVPRWPSVPLGSPTNVSGQVTLAVPDQEAPSAQVKSEVEIPLALKGSESREVKFGALSISRILFQGKLSHQNMLNNQVTRVLFFFLPGV